jgi:Domain of unknown function (DUF4396)
MERATATDEGAVAREESGMGAPLNRLAFSATLHCLTGCAIGEFAGMMLAMAFGWGDLAQIALAVGLAYLFGFSLTAIPLVRAGLAPGVIVSTALAADTVSITIMEVIDNVFVFFIPGAMEAGIDDPLIYATIAGGFAVAFPFAFWANRYMIARGSGHALVHEHHSH